MIRWLIERKLKKFELEFEYDTTYAREIMAGGLGAILRFSKAAKLSEYRNGVPLEAWYAAKVATIFAEDCGPCTQLVVKMAERDGVQAETLRAVLAGDAAKLPPDTRLAYEFARAVHERDLQRSDELRREVVKSWGQRGLISLVLTMTGTRIYPEVKYALGHGHSCKLVRVAGAAAPLWRRAAL
jgi:hypothetical protein